MHDGLTLLCHTQGVKGVYRGEISANDVTGSPNDLLQLVFFGLTGAAVPNSDGKSKETLHSSPVELRHDGGGHFKLPQLSQESRDAGGPSSSKGQSGQPS